MLSKLLETNENDLSSFIARVFLGVVILPHGLQKLLGIFGGYGFSATVDFFTGIGLPVLIAVLIILGESFGALLLIVGLISRLAAAGIAIIMLGAVFMVHLQYGFFMNWSGAQEGEGYEYHLLAIGLSLIVIIHGGGKWSVDGEIEKKAG